MKNEEIISSIKSLSELELIPVLEELREYLHKEKLIHLIEQYFDRDDLEHEIDNLEKMCSSAEENASYWEEEHGLLNNRIEQAITKVNEGIKDNVSDAKAELLNEILEILED